MSDLKGKTLFITGASRGIGLAIAKRAARDGANVAIAAKTAEPHKHLPGTIYTAAEEIQEAGGEALALVADVRSEDSVASAIAATVDRFGGIDICVNNASAINLSNTNDLEMKRYDLMHQVNARGTFLTSKLCVPHLMKSDNPHVLNLSPPLDMKAKWFAPHVAYSMAKYGMSLCVLGMAEEYRKDGIAFNALWPRTAVATAAVEFAIGDADILKSCRTPEILADAAYLILTKPSREFTGQFLVDDTFLYEHGVTDFSVYRVDPERQLAPDFFVPDEVAPPPGVAETIMDMSAFQD